MIKRFLGSSGVAGIGRELYSAVYRRLVRQWNSPTPLPQPLPPGEGRPWHAADLPGEDHAAGLVSANSDRFLPPLAGGAGGGGIGGRGEFSPPPDILTPVLRLASRFYEKGLKRDQARALAKRAKLPAFVISVGNLVSGGTGKTPLVIRLCRFLIQSGFHPAILSRGYRGTGKNPARVVRLGEAWEQSLRFGDEPVLMAEALPSVPVWVGRKRVFSGQAALAGTPVDTLVLDDGFQHLELHRDLDIVLLDCGNPFGNGRLLPMGPLREPVSHLERADVLVLTRAKGEAEAEKAALGNLFPGKPVFACRHAITGLRTVAGGALIPIEALRGRRVFIFAGIAGPEGFFRDIERSGANICEKISFPDHHRYEEPDLSRIVDQASRRGAEFLLTTAKDVVRLPPRLARMVMVAEMEIDFGADQSRFCEYLRERIARG